MSITWVTGPSICGAGRASRARTGQIRANGRERDEALAGREIIGRKLVAAIERHQPAQGPMEAARAPRIIRHGCRAPGRGGRRVAPSKAAIGVSQPAKVQMLRIEEP